jgi:hypothetical protein
MPLKHCITKPAMQEPVLNSERNSNRKMLLWFLIAIVIALLPWLIVAQATPDSGSESRKNAATEKPAVSASRKCEGLHL